MALSEAETAAGMIEVEVWVAVDNNEAVFVATGSDELQEDCNDNDCSLVRRVVCLTIKLQAPGAVDVAVELPAESSEASVTVK